MVIENYIYYQFKLFGIKLMSPVKYCLFVLLSLSMSQNNEGYVFKHSIDDQYYDIENIVEQHFGPWDIMINFSGRYKRKLVGIDEKTGEFTTLQHWEGVIANTRVDDKVEPNHDVQRFNESSYIEYLTERFLKAPRNVVLPIELSTSNFRYTSENVKKVHSIYVRYTRPAICFYGQQVATPITLKAEEVTLEYLTNIWSDYKTHLENEIATFETAIKNWKLQPTPREKLGKENQ